MTLLERLEAGFRAFDIAKDFIEKDYDNDYNKDYYYFNKSKLQGHSIMNGLFYQCCDYKDDSISTSLTYDVCSVRVGYFWFALNQEYNGSLINLYPKSYDSDYLKYEFRPDGTVELWSTEKQMVLDCLESSDDIFNARIQNFDIRLTQEELKALSTYIKQYSKYYDMYGLNMEIVL